MVNYPIVEYGPPPIWVGLLMVRFYYGSLSVYELTPFFIMQLLGGWVFWWVIVVGVWLAIRRIKRLVTRRI